MKLLTLKDFKDNLAGKRVLVRVDFNVVTDKQGNIVPGQLFRLERSSATINWLLKRGAKVIILSDRGRPHGRVVPELSNEPIAKAFSEIIDHPVSFVPYVTESEAKKAVAKLEAGQVLFLENLRFYSGENEADEKFARELASLGDFLINDAFAKAHRATASMTVLPKLLPSYVGLLLEEEVKNLEKITDWDNIPRPLVVVLGGAKCETKFPLIEKFLPVADAILVGGVLANTLLQSDHVNIGESVYEEDFVADGKILLKNKKIILPKDVVCDDMSTDVIEAEIKNLDEISKTDRIIDVGTQTAVEFSNYIRNAKTVLWNGPLGWIEKRQGSHASEALVQFISSMSHSGKLKSIIGGGETITVAYRKNALDDISFVSTGGGAMLDFLLNPDLPGLEFFIKS